MKAITRIYVVYAPVPFIVLEQDGVITTTGTSQDEIDFNELGNYVSLFKQQQDVLGNGYNWSRGTFTQNNKQFEAAIFDSIPGGSTPPPGAATKNFVFSNLSNIGTIEVTDITGVSFTQISGNGYKADFLSPVANSQALRGDLNATPVSGTGHLILDASGLSSPSDIRIWSFGESAQFIDASIDNGTAQDFPFPYDVSYGGSLFVMLVVGAQSFPAPAAPVARSGALRLDTTKPNYQINSVDPADITATGFTFPVSNEIQNGSWAMNAANNITVNITANVPPFGNAYVTCYVNGVAVDTKVVTTGTANYNLVNVPVAIPNGQAVRITVYGD